MNVFIDAHFLDKKKEGNRTFVLSLLSGFKKLGPDNRDIHFFLPVYRKTHWANRFGYSHFHWIDCSSWSLKRYLVDFPVLIRKYHIDLVQTIYHSPPFVRGGVKKVLVVHDLLPFSRPDLFRAGFKMRFKKMVKASEKTADKIVCGSRFTEEEIRKHLNIPRDRIEVISYGIDLEVNPTPPGVTETYSFLERIPNPFALFVGRLDKRKKISFLLDIIDILFDKWGLRLVVVGKRENISANLFLRLKGMEGQQKVIYTGEIPDNELGVLYRKADLLLYFPEAEGFGFPVIEAMKFGLPYLTVNRGALKEIALKEAFIDIGDRNQIIERIGDLMHNQSLRRDFIKRSTENLSRFSDVAMASRMLSLYRELTNRNTGNST